MEENINASACAKRAPHYTNTRWITRRIFEAKQLAAKGISLAFAKNTCLCCGSPSCETSLCPSCAQQNVQAFLPAGDFRCKKCGKPLLSEENLCMACRKQCIVTHCHSVFPIHTYRLWRKNLLFAWKMQDERLLTPLFAKIIYRALQHQGLLDGLVKKESVLVGVPPRPGKMRQRGWDQIEDVCKTLHILYGFPVLTLLKRVSREQQKKKNRTGRLETKDTAYALRTDYTKLLAHWAKEKGEAQTAVPKSAILIDDVITTGATVDACAALLQEAGIKKVDVISLFIVD